MFSRRGPSFTSQHFLRLLCPSSLVYSLRLRPFVSFSLAFLSRLPRLQRKDQRVAQFLTARPFPSALAASRSSRGAWELTQGRGGAGDASPGAWAEGRGQIRVAVRVNKGGARELGGERWGEGQVTVRDLTRAVPSEGCRACPSSPRKALLVNSSSAHSGDVGPELDSGSCDAEGPRETMLGPRMSAMLKGVRAVRGSGPELMAGRAVAVLPPAVLGSVAAWPQRAAPDLGPRPRTRPPRWARAPCAPPPAPPLPNPGLPWVWSW